MVIANSINNNHNEEENKKPLNRGDNYEQYDLKSAFNKYSKLKNILDSKYENDQIIKFINETKLKTFFKNEIKEIFKTIDKFKYNAEIMKLK